MFHLQRNQVHTSRNWKPSQREVLSKDAGPFTKMFFFSRCFSYIFARANQLAGFSISRLASVEDFFSVYIYFLYVNVYVSINDYLFKYIYLVYHLFCNVEFEFSWFHNTKQSSEILILKIEMLIEFQNRRILILLKLLDLPWICQI